MQRKIRIGLILFLLLALIAILSGTLIYLLNPSLLDDILAPSSAFSEKAPEPDELLQQYFSLVGNAKYEDMYEMLSDADKAVISREDFITKNKDIYSGIEAENISLAIDQVRDDTTYVVGTEAEEVYKVVEYTLRMDTMAGEITYHGQERFALDQNQQYRLRWSTHTIFPELAPDDRVRVRTLPASRGSIYDRNGELLAGAGVASAVGFVPGKMRTADSAALANQESVNGDLPEPEETGMAGSDASERYDMEDIAKAAGLLDLSAEHILNKLSASYVKEDTFVILKTIPKDSDLLKEELLTVPGILISDTPVRAYPLGEKASHLTGYIQNINAEELAELGEQGYHSGSVLGKAGLEKMYEEELRAMDGCEIVITQADGSLKQSLAKIEPVNGRDIHLTINAQTQVRLYDQLSGDKGCSVAMNPKTGEVLALVSTPSYDANDFVLGMSGDQWTALNEDADQPFFNRFQAALCPGSVMKAITAAIAVNTGAVTPEEDFGHSGLQWKKDESWGGYYITTTIEYEGPANIRNGLKYSDNIFFAKTAMEVGADRFAEELIKLGFEERIPFEYGLYSSIVSTTETIDSEIQLADSGFGQGEILTNPIHLASVYSAFVNDGDILQPRLLLEEEAKIWKAEAFSAETARIIREDLIQVIESGSAADAKVAGRLLGGKTGTAEIKQSKDDSGGTELGWFIEFTADEYEENPFLVAAMVEDVKGRGGSHYVSAKVKTLFE